MEPRTLAELTGQNIEIAFADAVAIAQQLICEPEVRRDAKPPYEALTLESIAVTADGAVRCLHTASTPTVSEVGLVMQRLLRNSPSLPGGLRYTVSRAIHEVEAPPFESVEDLSKALERFEAGDRREQIASLYQRAGAASESNAAPASSVPSESGSDQPERRTRQQSAASLRRQLREADQRFYESQLNTSQAHGPAEKGRSRRVPIAACMIAGVALVAAGEIAHVGQPARAMDARQPLPSPSSGVATTASADTLFEPAVATVPVTDSGKSPRPAVSRKGTGRVPANARTSGLTTQGRTAAATTKAAPRRPSNAFAPSTNKAAETRPKDEHNNPKSKPDKPDHGLLRIRFVWNNPFH